MGGVGVTIFNIDQELERHHAYSKFPLVFAEQLLGIVRSVERFAVGVSARTGMIAADNQVGAPVVLADDGMPEGFARAAHPHSQRQQGELHRGLRVAGKDRLVAVNASVVIEVTRLGHTHYGVNQEVGLQFLGCPQRQLEVRPVHRVSRLERDHSLPSTLSQLLAQLGWGGAKHAKVVVDGEL